MQLRVLLIGDIVGAPGMKLVERAVPRLRAREGLELVVANAENAAGGAGITRALAERLFAAGVDLITLGDHAFDRREALRYLAEERRLVRPLNYSRRAVGRGLTLYDTPSGYTVGLFQLQGRAFIDRPADCPFAAADEAVRELGGRARVLLCDMHAEATSEKMAMGWHLDGRASAVFGTHTHVPTADERVLPGGTAYITDLGMSGPYESVIGSRIEPVLAYFTTGMPHRFGVATGDVRLCGAVVTVEPETGRALGIRRLQLRAEEVAG
ncbi:MAG: metallophosphoesterase [Planctomycetota bacterium]|nr:MAG: metallophosphoesterase [Planctomycetota bacterium]